MIKYFKILLATATAKKTDRWIKIDSLITSKIVKNLGNLLHSTKIYYT